MTMSEMSFEEFCEKLREDGATVHEDGHIYRADGRALSRQCKNGYYMVRRMYGGKTYHFMEHRIVWYWANGCIESGLVINHKDFDRANNRIENLELVTQKENTDYSRDAGRLNPCRGADSPKARFTEKEVQLIRMLCKNGYSRKEVAELFDVKHANIISRVVTRARYGNVEDASTIISLYPLLVEKTCRSDLPWEEQIKNAALGLCGEAGEVVDLVKKHLYQGHPLDIDRFIEELGDVWYYATWLAILVDADAADVMFENMAKLTARYPDGFSVERSLFRKEGHK